MTPERIIQTNEYKVRNKSRRPKDRDNLKYVTIANSRIVYRACAKLAVYMKIRGYVDATTRYNRYE